MQLAAILIFGWATLNAIVTVSLLRSGDRYTSRQRAAQLGLIWLIPVFGVIVVWSLLRDPAPSDLQPIDTTDELSVSGIDSAAHLPNAGVDEHAGGSGY